MRFIRPRTIPGTLELLPLEHAAFLRMIETIRRNYERFGFVPIETPAIELSEILLTKTGGETERQVYFVQSTGSLEQGEKPDSALRFDLTVPLARYVAEHEANLNFPFRRYQIQRVYRGERAQRGRFREFYQCDIDVIGKDQLALQYDAEIPAVIYHIFNELEVGPFIISINNRKLIHGFFEGLQIHNPELQTAILREVDKMDKRGVDSVHDSLRQSEFGLDEGTIEQLMGFLQYKSKNHDDALTKLQSINQNNAALTAGITELTEVLKLVKVLGVPESHYALNFSIARGLDYYTGTVYETHLTQHQQIGSVCSGGRYDNLASHYTRSKLPGVGISIGATRLFWQLREAKLIQSTEGTVKVLITHMEDRFLAKNLELASTLRGAGFATQVQMDARKLAKQFQYADRCGIRFVVVMGESELAANHVTVKDMLLQTQSTIPVADIVTYLQKT